MLAVVSPAAGVPVNAAGAGAVPTQLPCRTAHVFRLTSVMFTCQTSEHTVVVHPALQVLTCVALFYAFSSGVAWRILHFFWIVSWIAPLLLVPVLSRLQRRVCSSILDSGVCSCYRCQVHKSSYVIFVTIQTGGLAQG